MIEALFAVLAAASIAAGAHLAALARGTFRTWLAMVRTPTSRIGSAVEGLIELNGRVVAGDSLVTDPIDSKPCVYYCRKRDVGHCGFVIDDGSGRARVELDDALVATRGDGDFSFEIGDTLYVLGPAQKLSKPDADGATLLLRATPKRSLFVAELAEQTAGRRLGIRAAAALALGGLLIVLGIAALLLESWLVWFS